jgi:hypothetical protein
MASRRLRIFISSPGDVGQERLLATRVIERLQGEFTGYLELEPILWEHEPLRASDHFQAQILPPSECDIVVCILWSRLGTRLPAQFQREDGSLYASGTEWEFEDALRAYREKGTPDILVYRKTAEPHASMSDEAALMARLQQKKALDAFIDRWFGNPQDSFRAAFHAFDTPDKFEATLETHLRRLVQERLPKMVEAADEAGDGAAEARAARTIRWHRGSPFRGLQAFDVEHAPVFFGRTRAVAAIKERLQKGAQENGCAFVLVFGMSGCGKSSLVRAGVLPTLTQPGVIDGIGLWRYGIVRPTDSPDDPFLMLAHGLTEEKGLPELTGVGLDEHEMAALLRQAPERAVATIASALRRAAEATAAREGLTSIPEARFCLVIDQLEEIFTLPDIDDRTREDFAAAVDALARSGHVWILATMRSDFYHRLTEVPALAALREGAGQYDVLPPSFAEVGQMIRNPARAAGLTFESRPATGERLDDVLHETAARDPEALPLLSFTLDQLFEQRTEGGTLTFAAYERMGGMEGALAQRAEEVFLAQPEPVQGALPALVRGLVTLGQRGEEVVAARRVPVSSLATTEERRALLDAFVGARLIVIDRADDGQSVARVAHEALIRHWPRLTRFLDEDREFFRVRDRVAGAATRWREEGRPEELLLPEGKSLADATDLLANRREDLSPETAEFVRASKAHVEGRRKRRVRVAAAVTGAFLVSVSGFGLFSYAQWRVAERNNRVALDAIDRLTHQIPTRLAEVPGTRPVLRSLLEENLSLLDRLGGARAGADRFDNLLQMGDIWMMLGETERAGETYEQSLKQAEADAKKAGGAADAAERAALNLAAARARLGDVRLQRGDPDGALAQYQAARDGLAALPETGRARRARAEVSEKVGDAHLALDDRTKALAAFDESARLVKAALGAGADEKDRAALQAILARAHLKTGDARRAADDLEGALAAYEESGALLKELAKTDPVAQRTLALLYQHLGDALFDAAPADSKRSYETALDLLKTLTRKRPDVTTQQYLADTYRRIAQRRLADGNLSGALSACDTALPIVRDLAENDPANAGAQTALAAVYDLRGETRALRGDVPGALADREAALQVNLRLAQRRDDQAARREQAGLWTDLGGVRLQRGDRKGARDAYQEAVTLRKGLAQGAAARGDRDALTALGGAYDRAAFVSLLLGDTDAARAIAEEGLAADPSSLRLQAVRAHALLLSGQFAEAEKVYAANRTARVDDRQRFDAAVRSDFRELRALGIDHPDMKKIEAEL